MFAALSLSPNPRVPASGALLVDLDGSLVEQPAQADPFTALAGRTPVDPRISPARRDPRARRRRDRPRGQGGGARSRSLHRRRAGDDRRGGARDRSRPRQGQAGARLRHRLYRRRLPARRARQRGLARSVRRGAAHRPGRIAASITRACSTSSASRPRSIASASSSRRSSPSSAPTSRPRRAPPTRRWPTRCGRTGAPTSATARPKAQLAAYVAEPERFIAAAGGDGARRRRRRGWSTSSAIASPSAAASPRSPGAATDKQAGALRRDPARSLARRASPSAAAAPRSAC